MKITLAPVWASVAFAAVAAAVFVPLARVAARFAPWALPSNLGLFLVLIGYVLMIAHLSGSGWRRLAPALAVLAAILPSAGSTAGFAAPAVVALAWVRSGICFRGPLRPRLVAEAVLGPAAIVAIAALKPPGPVGWALAVWLFFLVQASYLLFFTPGDRSAASPGIRPWLRPAAERTAELRREQRLTQAFERLEQQ